MKIVLFTLITLLTFSHISHASSFATVESRAIDLEQQLGEQHSYHAHLARQLITLARQERDQNDPEAALEFIALAEEQAALATGK